MTTRWTLKPLNVEDVFIAHSVNQVRTVARLVTGMPTVSAVQASAILQAVQREFPERYLETSIGVRPSNGSLSVTRQHLGDAGRVSVHLRKVGFRHDEVCVQPEDAGLPPTHLLGARRPAPPKAMIRLAVNNDQTAVSAGLEDPEVCSAGAAHITACPVTAGNEPASKFKAAVARYMYPFHLERVYAAKAQRLKRSDLPTFAPACGKRPSLLDVATAARHLKGCVCKQAWAMIMLPQLSQGRLWVHRCSKAGEACAAPQAWPSLGLGMRAQLGALATQFHHADPPAPDTVLTHRLQHDGLVLPQQRHVSATSSKSSARSSARSSAIQKQLARCRAVPLHRPVHRKLIDVNSAHEDRMHPEEVRAGAFNSTKPAQHSLHMND